MKELLTEVWERAKKLRLSPPPPPPQRLASEGSIY